MTAPVEVRFDDLETLQTHVSEAWGAFGPTITVTQAMIDQFAELTQDHQWIHIDPERCAAESPFGVPIAHGFLVLSLLTALTAEPELRLTGHGSVINYGADKLRFAAPVPAGSEVHARRRLVHVRKKGPKGTQLTFETEIHAVGADRPAVVYRSLVLFMA